MVWDDRTYFTHADGKVSVIVWTKRGAPAVYLKPPDQRRVKREQAKHEARHHER